MALHPGFILAEEAALKRHLLPLTVQDDREPQRALQVFYRYPEGETEKLYPFATVELLDIDFDHERQNSEVTYYYADSNAAGSVGLPPGVSLDYYPSEYTAANLQTLVPAYGFMKTDQFVAVNLMFQVTTFCRSIQHDIQLTSKILRRVFPFRRGFIDIPEDGTVRRLDLLDWRQSDLLDQETGYKKRIFRKVYSVRINAEIPQSDLENLQRVLAVRGTITDYDTVNPNLLTHITEDF